MYKIGDRDLGNRVLPDFVPPDIVAFQSGATTSHVVTLRGSHPDLQVLTLITRTGAAPPVGLHGRPRGKVPTYVDEEIEWKECSEDLRGVLHRQFGVGPTLASSTAESDSSRLSRTDVLPDHSIGPSAFSPAGTPLHQHGDPCTPFDAAWLEFAGRGLRPLNVDLPQFVYAISPAFEQTRASSPPRFVDPAWICTPARSRSGGLSADPRSAAPHASFSIQAHDTLQQGQQALWTSTPVVAEPNPVPVASGSGGGRIVTAKQEADIVELRGRGYTFRKISEIVGLPLGTAREVFKRMTRGVPEEGVKTPGGRHVSERGIERARELHAAGMNPTAVGNALGLTREAAAAAITGIKRQRR